MKLPAVAGGEVHLSAPKAPPLSSVLHDSSGDPGVPLRKTVSALLRVLINERIVRRNWPKPAE